MGKISAPDFSEAPQRDARTLQESSPDLQGPLQTSSRPVAVTSQGIVAIVGGSTINPAILKLLSARGATLVGADGGGDLIAAVGLTPAAIIGDMDSLDDPESWDGRSLVLRIEEQETTDLEKCLYSTAAAVTVILGATGGRFDHTLAALDAVAKYGRDRCIILVDETDLVLAVSGPFEFEVEEGARVSLHPMAPVRFRRSEGLRYALDGLTLAPGGRGGASNEALNGAFRIEPDRGETALWLLILALKYLPRLLDKLAGE
jgi:thiamine pyrophosphokinase